MNYEDFLSDFNAGMKVCELLKKYNLTRSQYAWVLKKNQLTIEYLRHVNREEFKVDYLGGMHTNEICKKYKIKHNELCRLRDKLCLSRTRVKIICSENCYCGAPRYRTSRLCHNHYKEKYRSEYHKRKNQERAWLYRHTKASEWIKNNYDYQNIITKAVCYV